MSELKPPVLVFSRIHTTGLSIIRSLGAAGYTVDLLACTHRKGLSSIASSSKYVRKSVEVVTSSIKAGRDRGEQPLVAELLKYAGGSVEKPVLFPTDDYTASVADRNKSILRQYFRIPGIVGDEDGALVRMMDKSFQAKMAREVGLLVPRQWVISLEGPIDIPEDMVYPCFCKPLESISGDKLEMGVCKDVPALMDHLEMLRKRFSGRSVLIQEFLEIDREIDLSGVCADQEIIIPGLIRKTRVAGYNKGVTLSGEVVPADELSDLMDSIVCLMRRFRYVGMFDMELNVVGDRIYFNEVNLRSGGPNYAYFAGGVNLPDLVVKALCGKPHLPAEKKITVYGKSFISEKVAWEDYIHGFMSKKELRHCIDAADITLMQNREDPKPGRYFQLMIRLMSLRSILTRVKKKSIYILSNSFDVVRRSIFRYPQTIRRNRRDPGSPFPRIMVIGRNYGSNLCMARSFGEAGYETEVIRVFPAPPGLMKRIIPLTPDAYSKYIKAYHVCTTCGKSQVLVDKLLAVADPDRKMLLIPTDDFTASIVDSHLDTLKEHYHFPNVKNCRGAIDRLMRKEIQRELAAAAGLPVIPGRLISTVGGISNIPESISYPCFLKPNTSKNTSKSMMRRCDSKEQLKTELEALSRNGDVEMLVEDYLDIRKEYALLGLSTPNGVVAPGFFVTQIGGNGSRKGVTMVGDLCDTRTHQDLIDDICRFVLSLGYEGLFDVDLIETMDGKIYFVELNLRYGASGYAVTRSGVDLPAMFADHILKGRPIDHDCRVDACGKTFINDKVALEEYMDGYLTWKQMRRLTDSADMHFIRNPEDPQAYRHFRLFYPAAALMRLARSIKKRKM